MATKLPQRVEEALAEAESAIDALDKARSFRAAAKAWEGMLQAASTATNRMEKPCIKAGQRSDYKALLTDIWADPIAGYMRAARNDHEHGIDITYRPAAPEARIQIGNFNMSIGLLATTDTGEQVELPVDGIDTKHANAIVDELIRMKPVMDSRNQVREPPPLTTTAPLTVKKNVAVARNYIHWLRGRLCQINVA